MAIYPQLEPDSFQESALAALDRLREAVTHEDVNNAVDHMRSLKSLLYDWQRSVSVVAAKKWIDDALATDLLLFNTETARQHLERWEEAIRSDDDPELLRYRGYVDERTRQKMTTLLVQGVVATCEDLFNRAAELERSQTPPHPDFMFTNYFGRAREIVTAARAEYPGNTELGILNTKAERQYNNKVTANGIYAAALERDAYAEALRDLNRLPSDALIPRYTLDRRDLTRRYLSFHSMIPAVEARNELNNFAGEWAAAQLRSLTQTVEDRMSEHDPRTAQAAIDVVGDTLDGYLPDASRQALAEMRSRVRAELRDFERAEERARYALQTAEINPIQAWEAYQDAQRTYTWAPSLKETRTAVVQKLSSQLERIIVKAEAAFNERNMDQVRQLHNNTHTVYGGKDEALDGLLERMAELEDMTRRYEEYLESATTLYTQVTRLIHEDSVATNDLLTQLESYPDLVLESFPDLGDLRQRVNRRLNADHVYNHLRAQMYITTRSGVEEAARAAERAADDYPDDNFRFRALARSLTLHADYLRAQEQHASGQTARLADLLNPVIAAPDHPDRDAALRLLGQQPVKRAARLSPNPG